VNVRDQVRQVSAATVEQAKHSRDIVRTVEQVKQQSELVTTAVKEQLIGMDEIGKGVIEAENRIRRAAAASQEQASHGRTAARELESAVGQAEDLSRALRTQSAGLRTMSGNWADADKSAQQGAQDIRQMASAIKDLIDQAAIVRNTFMFMP